MSGQHSVFKEFENLKGQFVLYEGEVWHFLGIGTDDHDYFYVLAKGRHDRMVLGTPLANLTQLKGKIEDKDYNEIVRMANLNYYYSSSEHSIGKRYSDTPDSEFTFEEFYNKARQEIIALFNEDTQDKHEYFGKNRLLTELCFDFN